MQYLKTTQKKKKKSRRKYTKLEMPVACEIVGH